MNGLRRQRALLLLALLYLGCTARAEPWMAPGNEGLRHDIQLLADAGILTGPVTTWPISWPDILRSLNALAREPQVDAGTLGAFYRVRRAARVAATPGRTVATRLSLGDEPAPWRGYAQTPRSEGEATMRLGWLGEHVAASLQATYVTEEVDGHRFRPDGSYFGVNVGNFMLSVGYMERWWGPGWDGSLILSTNARPIPSFTIERNYTEPFKTPLLSWLGPWRASIAVGEAEGHDVAVGNVRFLAARVNARPRPWLEFALTRTAQWCGDGRPCGLSTFMDLLIGKDNRDEELGINDEPGNQMAGYDLRLRSPWGALPLAVYAQWIGEDEAGGLPSKFIGLMGAEVWWSALGGSFRLRGEYTDTACGFNLEEPDLNCAYRNTLYPQGYSYHGRGIGHSIDNDSRSLSVAATHTGRAGVYSVVVRRLELNRDGGPHFITPVPLDLHNVELRASREFSFGTLSFGAGYDENAGPDLNGGAHGFVTWQQGF
jgi:hypothetical protein